MTGALPAREDEAKDLLLDGRAVPPVMERSDLEGVDVGCALSLVFDQHAQVFGAPSSGAVRSGRA